MVLRGGKETPLTAVLLVGIFAFHKTLVVGSTPDGACMGVQCGDDQKCVVRNNVTRCVCSPQCHLKHKEPVCGTDGRTYSSECHLLKRACRKQRRLMVAHNGPCQTCTGMRCGPDKKCVLDDKLNPRCRRCPVSCSEPNPLKLICGINNITYASPCHLKMGSCAVGRSITRAYKGLCRQSASCSNVRCWRGDKCLTHLETGTPRCTWCGRLHDCRSAPRPVCVSDGSSYTSFCALRHDECRTGKAHHIRPYHKCRKKSKTSEVQPIGGQCEKKARKKRRWRIEKKKKGEQKYNKNQRKINTVNLGREEAGNQQVPQLSQLKDAVESSVQNFETSKKNRKSSKTKRKRKKKGCKIRRQRKPRKGDK